MSHLAMLILAQGLTYADVKTIVDAKCAGPCHNGDGAAFFLPFGDFAEIKGNQDQMIRMIESDQMPQGEPPGFKTSAAGVKLRNWLKAGTDLYPDAGQQCPEVPLPHVIMKDPRQLTYTDVKPIIDRNCVGCHNPEGRASRRSFSTLTAFQRNGDHALRELERGRMPQGNPEFRFTPDGRTLIGWLRYSRDGGSGDNRDDD